jgi:hypothetical protein
MAGGKGWLGFRSLNHLAPKAYERLQGETTSLDEALETALRDLPRPADPGWNVDDDDENGRHLPRLAALFL